MFLYATQHHLEDLTKWRDSYLNHIKRNEKTYRKKAVEDAYLLHLMTEEKILSENGVQELLKIAENGRPELTALLLDYQQAQFGGRKGDLSLSDDDPEMKRMMKMTRLRKEIDEKRKEVKRNYLAPYNAFEAQVKELLALIDLPLDEIKAVVAEADERERAAKKEEVHRYFLIKTAALGNLAESLWNSPAFAESKWFTKSCSASVWQREVAEKAAEAARELELL